MVYLHILHFIRRLSGKESTRNAGATGDPWVGKIPLEEGMATHSREWSGESHGQRSQADYSPQGRKELDMTEVT